VDNTGVKITDTDNPLSNPPAQSYAISDISLNVDMVTPMPQFDQALDAAVVGGEAGLAIVLDGFEVQNFQKPITSKMSLVTNVSKSKVRMIAAIPRDAEAVVRYTDELPSLQHYPFWNLNYYQWQIGPRYFPEFPVGSTSEIVRVWQGEPWNAWRGGMAEIYKFTQDAWNQWGSQSAGGVIDYMNYVMRMPDKHGLTQGARFSLAQELEVVPGNLLGIDTKSANPNIFLNLVWDNAYGPQVSVIPTTASGRTFAAPIKTVDMTVMAHYDWVLNIDRGAILAIT
jgi:hypothetical protein